MSTLALPVIPLMVVASLCLVFSFLVFFLCERSRRLSNPERESLLHLGLEAPRVVDGRARLIPVGAAHRHDEHAGDGCGCHSGEKAPCPGCLKRSAVHHQ